MRLLIKNASQVVRIVSDGQRVLRGEDQQNCDLAILRAEGERGLSVAIDDQGKIASIGSDDAIAQQYGEFQKVIDANQAILLPGFVDAHTHPVWAGDRVHEFAMKLAGKSYMEIYEAGGGIHYTVRHTKEASEDELFNLLKLRLTRMLHAGTTLVEAKSGYGLDTENEMKMLRVLERAKREIPISISSTFCGAHAVPKGMTAREATVNLLEHQFPELVRLQNLGEISVDSVDVFCEKGVFEISESQMILEAGRRAGLRLNFHADELNAIGGAELGASLGAEAISHLEEISSTGIEAMAQAKSVAVILPSTAFLLRLKSPPVRAMIEAGVAVALGSDFNPNAYCFAMPLIINFACVLCKMNLNEALVAATLNSAAALGKSETHGSIEVGKAGDILLVAAPSWEHVIYQMGGLENLVVAVVKDGNLVYERKDEVTKAF